jgi:hypothetical protein
LNTTFGLRLAIGWMLAAASLGGHAETQKQLPKCSVAQLIVDGAYREAQAKQHGQSYDQQVQATHLMAGKLTVTYGSKVGGTYDDVQVKLLQNLYTNPAYAGMSPDQFRDVTASSFFNGCGQSI